MRTRSRFFRPQNTDLAEWKQHVGHFGPIVRLLSSLENSSCESRQASATLAQARTCGRGLYLSFDSEGRSLVSLTTHTRGLPHSRNQQTIPRPRLVTKIARAACQ